jgi:hypothetical protein
MGYSFLYRSFLSLFICILLTSGVSLGQSISKYHIGADIEAATVVTAHSAVPFWLRTNQYGVIPASGSAGLLQVRFWREYAKTDSLKKESKKMDWGFVINPVATYQKENNLRWILPEAHFKARFRALELYVGRRRELVGLGDSVLSSGFYAGSGNALPIPKIQFATVGYVPVAFRKFLAVNAGFAHGWNNDPPNIYGARLHQKHLYFRLGRPASKTKVYFGMNHQAIWAGHSDYLKNNPGFATDGKLPDSWKFYHYIVLGYTPKDWDQKGTLIYFDSYRIGNHLGSYDVAVDTRIMGKKLMLYHQHPYEDVSSFAFKNIPDGLYGASLHVNSATAYTHFRLTRLTVEFLTTKDQSGSQFDIPGSAFQGADNYFNHSQYTAGWSYRGRAIGTPFIAPGKDLDRSKPMAPRFFPNNRVNMWYAGAQGTYKNSLLLTIRASYSRNFGMFGDAFSPPRGQFSSFLSADLKMEKWYNTSIVAKLSVDKGDLFPDSYGGFIGVRKSW